MLDAIFELSNKAQDTAAVAGQFIPSKVPGVEVPVGIKTGDELIRVDPVRLEQEYAQDPLCFNIVNKYVHGICAERGHFYSPDAGEQEILHEYERAFRLNTYLLPKIVQDMCVFGSHWSEKIWNVDRGKLLRLDVRDAKYMDISKYGYSQSSFPLVDDLGRPHYYCQYLNMLQQPRAEKDVVWQLGRRAVKYDINDVLKINMLTLGDSEDGMGIVEPLYQALKNKQQIEQATSHAILRMGQPKTIGYVGNERVYPTKQLIDEVSQALMNMDARTGLTLPNYVKVETLEAKEASKMTENMNYFIDMVVAGGGLPSALATGSGQGANKHTLQALMNFMGGAFYMIRSNIAEAFEFQVLRDIKKLEGMNNRLRFKWVDRSKEDADETD